MSLDRDEQLLIRRAGGFFHVLAHKGPTSSIPGWPIQGGSSAPDLFGRDGWIDYAGKGVKFSYWTESDPNQLVLMVTWAEVRHHARCLGDSVLTQIRVHLNARREHQTAMPSYPQRAADPERWAEVNRYFHDVHMPAWRVLNDAGTRLLDLAYPLTVEHEPTDLFELLALQEATS